VLIAPPPGPAYNFIVNLYVHLTLRNAKPSLTRALRYTYPGAWINTFVAGGLIYLRLSKSENWSSPWQTYLIVPFIYLCLNIFLVVTPFVPPNSDWNADGYPYYAFPLVGTGVLVLGGFYWLVWTRVWPRPVECGPVAYGAIGGVDERVVYVKAIEERVLEAAEAEPLIRGDRVGGYYTLA